MRAFCFFLRVVVGMAAGAWLLAAPPAARAAVQVEIHFPVLERALSEQMFAQDSRSASPPGSPRSCGTSSRNMYLNGEVIRLDAALRIGPN